ncbi:hypothetical protein ACVGVM_26890 [Pseudonocardia bannensis]
MVFVILAGFGLVGCGAPAFTYVTNSGDRTYLKVPASWQQIDSQELARAIGVDPSSGGQAGLWMVGYDADISPSPVHLFGPHTPAPAVFVGVKAIPPAARGQLSLDTLRDIFYPVSPTARQQLGMRATSTKTDFALLADEVLTPGHGLRGVHVVYRYRQATGPAQIVDQTGYLNDDASKLYVAFVRCSSECYQQRQQEIQNVVSSFTVRETP